MSIWSLLQSDRPCVFMATRGLRRVVKNQNREAAAGGESFSCGCEVAGKNIGFAYSIVVEEAIGQPWYSLSPEMLMG
jgi:hypothetical protein